MSERPAPNTRTLDFFRSIWPTTGYYCIALKTERGMRQSFFATMDEAAAFALHADAHGIETYMACASFKTPDSRKGANVEAVKCFWMDIDCGEGKPYADPKSAFEAIKRFLAASGLPQPLVVFSGGGWHLYWCLQQAISPAEWKPLAAALKLRAAELGLAADPARTGDIASILRPVGCHNHKRLPYRGVIAGEFCSYSIDQLAGFGVTQSFNAVDLKKFEVHTHGESEPSYGRVIASSCGQLRNFRDSRGQLPEPEWYAGLCVLAHCTDGESLAHEWSAGDGRYSFADTQRKLEHGRADSGPTTCERFQRLNPAPCMGCAHAGKVTSPIQLGRTNGEAAPVAAGELPKLVFPFMWGENGALTIQVENEAGEKVREIIYKAPLFVSGARRHELTEQFSVVCQHWLPHEGWQEAVLPWDDHTRKTVVNRLGARGINVHGPNEKYVLPYLHAAIDQVQAEKKVDMEYAQFGWKGDFEGFLLGNELFMPGKPPQIVGVSDELKQRMQGMKAYGTFEGWRSSANSLFQFERQGLMVVAGFASILMAFAQESGGLVLSAVSEEGGKGKTLGLRGAQTAWGTDSVTAISKTDTANSRFKLISLLGGLPITWDEMRDRDPEIVKDFVLTFSGGRDKNRLDKNAALRQNARNWSTILIATSNISVAELVSHDGETAQQARILEMVFEDLVGVKASDGKEIERQLIANRGHAGRRFIQALMLPGMIDWCRQSIPTYAREFEQQLGENNTILRFYTNGLACIKAAGIILNRAHILEFSVDRLIKYAMKAAEDMASKLMDPRRNPNEVLSRFINENWENALVVVDAWKPKANTLVRREPRKTLALRYEENPRKLYIDRQFLRDWCAKKRVMHGHLATRLIETGVLASQDKKINLGAGTTFAAGGQVLTWECRVTGEIEIPEIVDNVVRLK